VFGTAKRLETQGNVIAKRFEDSMYLKRAQTLVLSTTVENKHNIRDHQFPLHTLNVQKIDPFLQK